MGEKKTGEKKKKKKAIPNVWMQLSALINVFFNFFFFWKRTNEGNVAEKGRKKNENKSVL